MNMRIHLSNRFTPALLSLAVVVSILSCDKNEIAENFDIKEFHLVNATSSDLRVTLLLATPDSILVDTTIRPGDVYVNEAASWGGLALPFPAPCCRGWTINRVRFTSTDLGCVQFSPPANRTQYAEGEGPFNGLKYEEFDSALPDDQQPPSWTYYIDSLVFSQGSICP